MRNLFKFVLACGLLFGTGLFLHIHHRQEVFVARQQLASLPHQLGSWKGKDIAIDDDVRQILGNGDFLSRIYQDDARTNSYVDLFIAYFPSQGFGDTIHSPKNCLPGSGWLPLESSKVEISIAGREPFAVNRYIVAKGENRELILYWYLARNRITASEYWSRYYLFIDSLRVNRTDGSLIRLITPLDSGETVGTAQERLLSLARNIAPILNLYVPS